MSHESTSWLILIQKAMEIHHESWVDVVDLTLTKEELEEEFDPGYGGTNGKSFTLWTKHRVYFPACYDGSEWCASVARNPDEQPTDHIGGG